MPDGRAVAFVHDVICPWCHLGRRQLQAAARSLGTSIDLRPVPMVLDDAIPAEGIRIGAYLRDRLSPTERARTWERLNAMGREVGIEFAFDDGHVVRPSLKAHMTVLAAGDDDAQSALLDCISTAYFEAGEDIAAPDVLRSIAAAFGVDGTRLERAIGAGPEGRARFDAAARPARRWNVRSTPFAVDLATGLSVSGAVGIEGYARFLRAAAAEPERDAG